MPAVHEPIHLLSATSILGHPWFAKLCEKSRHTVSYVAIRFRALNSAQKRVDDRNLEFLIDASGTLISRRPLDDPPVQNSVFFQLRAAGCPGLVHISIAQLRSDSR